MQTQLKDVIHFYLGCKCVELFKLRVGKSDVWEDSHGSPITLTPDMLSPELDGYRSYKLILRPLSSMIKEEEKEFDATKVFIRATPVHQIGAMHWTSETYRWLLSKHFDLFNLIETGQAIEKHK